MMPRRPWIRRWLRRIGIALLALVVVGVLAYRALFIPAVYFRVALFVIEHNALMRDRVDWPAVRQEADRLLQGARTTRDTYPAIQLVLRRLGDHHSHLALPETVRAFRSGSGQTLGLTALWPERVVSTVSPAGPAAEAGIAVGDVIEAVDGSAPEHIEGVVLLPRGRPVTLRLRRAERAEPVDVRLVPRVVPVNQTASVRLLDRAIGYVDIPGVVGAGEGFDTDAVAAIRRIDTAPICGWVVDLRRNLGGNMWPMLHALRPILGEGNPFSYRFGKAPWENKPVYSLKQPNPAIAVLTSRLTVSSGELVTIAFRGPATTRIFGEATAGLPTSNMDVPLVDGAVLVVTVSRAADRTGREYDGPIQPDEVTPIDWPRLGHDGDPVIRAAQDWLVGQPPCRAVAPGVTPDER
jgi:carboxyl-terminal processing protease